MTFVRDILANNCLICLDEHFLLLFSRGDSPGVNRLLCPTYLEFNSNTANVQVSYLFVVQMALSLSRTPAGYHS